MPIEGRAELKALFIASQKGSLAKKGDRGWILLRTKESDE